MSKNLINRPNRESVEALMEVFGTPRPQRKTIARWKSKWRDEHEKYAVKNFTSTMKFMEEHDIDPLFYQFYAEPGGITDNFYVVFWKDEHELFYKLHAGIV